MFRLWKPAFCLLAIFQVGCAVALAQEDNLKSTEDAAIQMLSSRGEVIIRFIKPEHINLSEISLNISIDDFRNDTIIAYVDEEGFSWFLKLKIPYMVVEPPSLKTNFLTGKRMVPSDWRMQYPTYPEYLELMEQFADNYPDLCRMTEFGKSVDGRKLMAVKITDHPEMNEKEPVLLYTSTMHGDEPLGFVLMIRLIDYLLSGYATDSYIKSLVDRIEIWINPLSNPDGVYFLSDTTIVGATRFNSNQVDLNRDFPDINGNPDLAGRQPETLSMMSFMDMIRPVLAANFHGGAEVVNYPWDSWYDLHADNLWYRAISRTFADTAQYYGPAGYMTFLENGITNGSEWYPVIGGRQDYVNYFLHGREVTIELSNDKIPVESSLDNYWNYTNRSLLHYMEEALTGITGEITDSLTGMPLRAQVRIPIHDVQNSFVYSEAGSGSFFRLLPEGEFSLSIEAPGYTYKNASVSVSPGQLTQLDIKLSRGLLHPNPFTNVINLFIPYSGSDLELVFIDMMGRKVKYVSQPVTRSGMQPVMVNDLASGYYIITVTYNDQTWKLRGVKAVH